MQPKKGCLVHPEVKKTSSIFEMPLTWNNNWNWTVNVNSTSHYANTYAASTTYDETSQKKLMDSLFGLLKDEDPQ